MFNALHCPTWKINNNPNFRQLPKIHTLELPRNSEASVSLLRLTYAQRTMEPIIAIVLHASKIFQFITRLFFIPFLLPQNANYPLESGNIWSL